MEEPKIKSLAFVEVLKDARKNAEQIYFVDRLQTSSEKFIEKISKKYKKHKKRKYLCLFVHLYDSVTYLLPSRGPVQESVQTFFAGIL